ncbi:hypothetical protein BsWGS_15182 [Bradybaena similaris]
MENYLSTKLSLSQVPNISSNGTGDIDVSDPPVASGLFHDQSVHVNALSSRTVEGLSQLSYSKHIMSTLVLLFYLFGLPVIVVVLVLLWRAYLNVCENCERTMSRRHSVTYSVVDMQDFRLRHECCKKNVAPILFSLPTDFNFKHNCGAKCKGPKVWQPENFP